MTPQPVVEPWADRFKRRWYKASIKSPSDVQKMFSDVCKCLKIPPTAEEMHGAIDVLNETLQWDIEVPHAKVIACAVNAHRLKRTAASERVKIDALVKRCVALTPDERRDALCDSDLSSAGLGDAAAMIEQLDGGMGKPDKAVLNGAGLASQMVGEMRSSDALREIVEVANDQIARERAKGHEIPKAWINVQSICHKSLRMSPSPAPEA